MDQALSNDRTHIIPDGQNATVAAFCPECEQPVARCHRQDTNCWRHIWMRVLKANLDTVSV